MNNAKDREKKIVQERLEISSRNLELPRNISCKTGTKNRNCKDLKEAAEIKKRW